MGQALERGWEVLGNKAGDVESWETGLQEDIMSCSQTNIACQVEIWREKGQRANLQEVGIGWVQTGEGLGQGRKASGTGYGEDCENGEEDQG